MKKIIDYFINPRRIVLYLINNNCLNFISDKLFLKLKYRLIMRKKLNLDNPQTFNEKLQWLKLYDQREFYTVMVDKYEAKRYISNIIGDEYIIPTIGVYNNFDDIDFNNLPNKFVIKCTHDSGGLIVVKDKSKFDILKSRKIINKYLKRNYYKQHREWPYKNVKPRIIIEKYIEDSTHGDLRDYKFFCFNGSVKCFKIDFNRTVHHQANYYDEKGNLLKFGEMICPPNFSKELEIPKTLNEMIGLAKRISKDIPFVRIDFYSVNNKIYFGEATFFPAAGFGKFIPDEWDYKLGSYLKLPIKKEVK